MQVLLDFIRRYVHIFLFVLLETMSAVMLFRFNNYQGSAWLSGLNTVTVGLGSLHEQTLAYFRLQSVNTRLTTDNIRLQHEADSLREALARATHQPAVTERRLMATLNGYRLIPATVVSNSIRRDNNYLVINRGAADGVRSEMGVVASGGVVGIVYLTAPHHALVLPVTNVKSSISCRVRGQHYFGYLQWKSGSSRHAFVDDIPRYAKVKPGACIETSGYSAVFPPGLFVGRVKRVGNSPDGQSYQLDVVLGNDFADLHDVAVIATPYRAEIDTLQTHAAAEALTP